MTKNVTAIFPVKIEDFEILVHIEGTYYAGEHRMINSASERPNDPPEADWIVTGFSIGEDAAVLRFPPALILEFAASSNFSDRANTAIAEAWIEESEAAAERAAEMRREP